MSVNSSAHSVTEWIADLKQTADSNAAQQLWERYLAQLVALAQRKLQGGPGRAVDGEDIAQMAFASFFRRATAGQFSRLDDREDLWQILVMLVSRKAIDQLRKDRAQKHGGGKVRGESVLEKVGSSASPVHGIDAVDGGDPTPEFSVEVAERFERLLEQLGDDVLRKVALGKMEGYTNAEIAQQLNIGKRSVERKLELIRATWQREMDQS